jgi:hypothetical protein
MGAMLTFSHDTRPEKRPVDLCALLTEATDLLRQTLPSSIGISTRSDVAANACWILGDRAQLQQVLLNLALNAGDAMPNGGKLSISLTDGACETEKDFAKDARPALCLEVTDSGKGIAPEVKERIFEPFFTTKARGQSTGLGLAIVHAVAVDHGATIDVSSVPGEGTTFRLCFPRDDPPAATPVPAHADRSDLVLIATRDPYEAQLLASAVGRLGIASALVGSWGELTAALKRVAAATVLIDAGFCERGVEACSRAFAATGARPRVLVMAGPKDPSSLAYEDAGFMVLERPLALAEVARLVAGSEAGT